MGYVAIVGLALCLPLLLYVRARRGIPMDPVEIVLGGLLAVSLCLMAALLFFLLGAPG